MFCHEGDKIQGFFLFIEFCSTRCGIRIQRGNFQRRINFPHLYYYYIMSYPHKDIKGEKQKEIEDSLAKSICNCYIYSYS